MYIDDCLKGIQAIMHSEVLEPINLGSSELISVNELVDIAEEIAGVRLKRVYDPAAPQGVTGRNSDNTRIKQYLNWEPSIPFRQGLVKTYDWIYREYMKTV
jgi:nucleoside-diphosphate-sugar epimerase